MRAADQKVVRQLPLFREMADGHFEALISAAYLQRFPGGVVLISEGDTPDFLHIVIDGAVEMFASANGRQTTLDVISPLTTFILAAVIRDEVYLKSARTLVPTRILMIPAEAVHDAFDRDNAFARAVVAELADRYRSLVRELKNQKLRTSVERLANWILKEDGRRGDQGRIQLSYDKRTLASQLGMTAENLSRNFLALADHGISTRGKRIVITDRAALERYAKPNSLIDN